MQQLTTLAQEFTFPILLLDFGNNWLKSFIKENGGSIGSIHNRIHGAGSAVGRVSGGVGCSKDYIFGYEEDQEVRDFVKDSRYRHYIGEGPIHLVPNRFKLLLVIWRQLTARLQAYRRW